MSDLSAFTTVNIAAAARTWTPIAATSSAKLSGYSGWSGAILPGASTAYFYGIDSAGGLEEYSSPGVGGFPSAISTTSDDANTAYSGAYGDVSDTATANHNTAFGRFQVRWTYFAHHQGLRR